MPVPIGENSAGLDLSARAGATKTVVASPTASTETIIASLTLNTDETIVSGIILRGFAAFTVGTSGVSVQFRIRQTNVSGTAIADTGAITGGVAAGNVLAETILGFDTAPALTGQVYVLTMRVASGAATSTVSAVELDAIIV